MGSKRIKFDTVIFEIPVSKLAKKSCFETKTKTFEDVQDPKLPKNIQKIFFIKSTMPN